MERRELFTRLFSTRTLETIIEQEPAPIVQHPVHLNINEVEAVHEIWYTQPDNGIFEAETNISFGLEYRMEIIPEIVQETSVCTVNCRIKGQNSPGIDFGLNESCCLFIQQQVDNRQTDPDSLLGAVQLVLNITPQGEGRAYCTLKLIDHYGMTLATLEYQDANLSDWEGVFLPGKGLSAADTCAPGWKIRSVQLNGYRDKRNNLTTPL